ncbi:MAG: hypothetical protein ACJ76B_09030 [Solirubrobacterales bacterium]
MLREHIRARDLFIQNDQDLHPQGVGEGFGNYLFYALFFVFGLRHGLFFGSFPGGNGRYKDFTPCQSGFSQRSRVFRLLTSFTGQTLNAGILSSINAQSL